MFSKRAEKKGIFANNVSVQADNYSSPIVTLDIRLEDEEIVVEDDFFALKIVVRTKSWTFGKVVRLKQLRQVIDALCFNDQLVARFN